MTIGNFLAQAGFWQWVGMICLAGVLSQWRLFSIRYWERDKKVGNQTPTGGGGE